jgi:hypothetical protein
LLRLVVDTDPGLGHDYLLHSPGGTSALAL